MTPERYQQIKQLYWEALDRDPAGRSAWLAEACGTDQALCAEVEMLLSESAETAPFLETPPPLPGFPSLPKRSAADELIGQRIGSYKILREIGQGGMGAVYMAERADEQYRKRVALKLVKRGMDTEEILSRFRHERQILASLDHPNIARLIDGGTTEDGLPYFVMEYIEGQPIDLYCSTHKLNINERLNLFRTVCSAVHYAHQNLVVHRDLKPSNILVTADGTLKLLDFGIAKILNPDLFPDVVLPTKTWERPMTPAYASPEQVRGHAITTASDVYSLGMILYELLTGQRPYLFKGHAPHEIAKVVCETEPDRPSTAVVRLITPDTTTSKAGTVEADKLRKLLKGDLDNIVLMALRKEPQRRYASVEQFSEDIRRHLDGLPVIAREDSFRYRAEKFIGRNRLAVAAATMFVLLLAGFLVTTLVQAQRIRRERDTAQIERDKAEQVSRFLGDLFKVSDPSEARGNSVTAREILDRGAEKIRGELKDQPETKATLMETIGRVFGTLGLHQRAVELLEEALSLRRQVHGNESAEVARTLTYLVQSVFELGDSAKSEALTREALAIRRKVFGSENVEVAESLNDLALLTKLKGDFATAEQMYREALAVRRKLLKSNDPEIAATLNNLAVLMQDKKDYDAALSLQREALAIKRQAQGADSPDVAVTLHNMGALLRRKGDLQAAEQTYREALALRRKIYHDPHPDLAMTLHNLGTLMRENGSLVEAETLLKEAVEIRRRTMPAGNFYTGRSLIDLGKVYFAEGNLPRAEECLREGYGIVQTAGDKSWIAHAQDGLGDCQLKRHRYAEAEQLFLQAQQYYQNHEPGRATSIGEKLARLAVEWGKPEKAAAYRSLISK